MRKAAAFIVALVFAVFLSSTSGCLQKTASQESPFVEDYRNNLQWTTLAQAEACKPGSCWCYVCSNGTNLFGPMRNLIGGNCYFQQNCTPEVMAALNNKSITKNATIRTFLLGQGTSFSDFSNAQQYCNERLSMAVQWLVGTNETPYQLPSAARSMCLLSKDVIPIYVLYSKGENINISQSRKIGEVLGKEGSYYVPGLTNGPVGPVVVVTEMNFNGSNASQVALVADQVRAIDQYCNGDARSRGVVYCQIAVAPRVGDVAALDAVMRELGTTGDEKLVDLVAYGVDGRYMSMCSTDGSCNPYVLWEAARKFSRYSLYNWSKPSIIPYILIEPNTPDVTGAYTYTEEDVVATYRSFFPGEPIALKSVGVVGAAPYSYNSSAYHIANPLGCVDCDVASKPKRLQAWYAGCQAFTNNSGNPSAGVFLAFPNESGGFCGGTMENADFMFNFKYVNQDISTQPAPELQGTVPKLYSCDECVEMSVSGTPPYAFTPSAPSGGTASCDIFSQEIDAWAGARSLDPMLVRAFVITESANLDPCSAARVCKGGYNDASCFEQTTNKDECYDSAYSSMSDPAPSAACTFSSSTATPPNWRWCGLGIMQTLVPPYDYWPAQYREDGSAGPNVAIYNDAISRGMDRKLGNDLTIAKACNPTNFDPFNTSDSICMGTAKMESAMRGAQQWLNAPTGTFTNKELLGLTTSDPEKERAMAAYISAHIYVGDWYVNDRLPGATNTYPYYVGSAPNSEFWSEKFHLSSLYTNSYCSSSAGQSDSCCNNGVPLKDATHCCGYTDFIKYMKECAAQYMPYGDRGAKKMNIYYWLIKNCDNSFCPDGKRFLTEWCKPDAQGKYDTQRCIGPNQPKLPASGTPYVPDG